MDKRAIQFGAGSIGRGFIALLLCKSGYRVTFADVQENVISRINQHRRYTVEVLGEKVQEVVVEPVEAMHSGSDSLLDAFVSADLVTTAVGPGVLKHIAPTIAGGIGRRYSKGVEAELNVVACENMVGGSSHLAELVYSQLDDSVRHYADRYVGFPDAAVDRIVPPGANFEDPLRVRVEEFSEWIVDEGGFKGSVPAIEGMTPTDRLPAYLDRKLLTLNTGHAATAYLGAFSGYRTIDEAIRDPEIRSVVEGCMRESGEVLIRRYGFDARSHGEYIEKIIERFSRRELSDEVSRVGRNPVRKLGREDRLIKPLIGCLEYGIKCEALIIAISAALSYRNRDDSESVQLERELTGGELLDTLSRITGLGREGVEGDGLARIARAYCRLTEDGTNFQKKANSPRWSSLL